MFAIRLLLVSVIFRVIALEVNAFSDTNSASGWQIDRAQKNRRLVASGSRACGVAVSWSWRRVYAWLPRLHHHPLRQRLHSIALPRLFALGAGKYPPAAGKRLRWAPPDSPVQGVRGLW